MGSNGQVTETTRHLTASMVVVDPRSETVLLVWHNATGRWMFPGGHVDADEAPAEAALREVEEETGVKASVAGAPAMQLPGMRWLPSPWLTAEIPAPAKPERPGKPAEPAHSHIDLLFLGVADSRSRLVPRLDEVASARWQPVDEVDDLAVRAEVPQLARLAYAAVVVAESATSQKGGQC